MTRNAPRRGSDQREATAYIAELAANLAGLAHKHSLGTLGYLLDMARMEAEKVVEIDEGDSP